ncbi:MAG: 50S ribosomal protein L11 [Nanoarchaeota archaeon]|nr:50S ribosomal protein L11 [Nanoarchaeota archaeon]MBU0962734.1 50S ribosomal protein L11 [Nanoarchaeota archaeon]
MSKLKLIVDGGKATANPQFAQALGPLGIMQNVLNDINQKTVDFKGIKVPVEIDVNKDKTYNITIGTPSASELIKSELKAEKGAGYTRLEKIGNLAVQDVIKIAKMKRLGLLVNNLKSAIKTILGTCNQMGVLVENKDAKDVSKDVENGVYDKIISKEETEVSAEKRSELKKTLEEMNQKFSDRLKKKKEEEELKEKKSTATPAEGAAPTTETKPAAVEKKPAEKKEAKK